MVAAIENPYSQPPRLSHVDVILGRTGINPAMPGRELKGHRHLDFVSDSLANGRRIKCLTIADDFTREVIAIWRQDYNEVRPHGTIGRIPPAEFAAKHRKPNPSTTDAGSVNLQTLGPLSN